ncbi:disease resistance protein RGA2-like [Phragmites australis]|uniref:disease resistance protein RGA2-like n=1 Tax=Phragmites australis TaxID=29695 RepID=UPI002D78BE96|nr:disease resistance protein RGA2-like [Phragmites australis]
MDFTKEVVVPAALSEILGRIFSFLFDNFYRPAPGARDVHRRRLEQLLGNIGSMVEEAEGRHITNQQLLAHLKALTVGMYRGRFALEVTDLDDVKNAVGNDNGDDGDAVNAGGRSFALSSSFNSAKRARVMSLILGGGGGGGDDRTERLSAVIEELESLTRDYMREFIMLVQGYPRKVHRPVRTTLYMDRCVFGRHVEKERIVDFLLQRTLSGRAPYLSMLAVVGAKKVGKTTLVKHACDDERVRDHFARIEWFETPEVVRAGGRPDQTMWESDGPEYFAGVRRILGEPRFAAGRSLLVFEDAWPIDEAAWSALAATPSALADGSKLLLTCRDTDLARLGTVEPVVLNHLQEEEYWYYFKAFAFGGADPREHPRIAAVAREISEHLERTFLDARVLGTLLKANFDARFWRRVLAAIVKCERRPLHVGVLLELLPVRGRLQSYGYCRSPPKFTVQDVLSARAAGDRDGDSEEGFTIHLCRETLYMDHWYSITFKNDGVPPPHAVTT